MPLFLVLDQAWYGSLWSQCSVGENPASGTTDAQDEDVWWKGLSKNVHWMYVYLSSDKCPVVAWHFLDLPIVIDFRDAYS